MCVVDANEVDPSLAVRLGLHPQPNVATAAARPSTSLSELVAEDLQEVPDARVWALVGLADPAQWSTVTGQALASGHEARFPLAHEPGGIGQQVNMKVDILDAGSTGRSR